MEMENLDCRKAFTTLSRIIAAVCTLTFNQNVDYSGGTSKDRYELISGCFAVYQVLLGSKTYKYFRVMKPHNSPTTDQPDPKEKLIFFPRQMLFFGGLRLVLHRKQTTRNPKPTKILGKLPAYAPTV